MGEATARTQAMRIVMELREKILSGELTGGTRLLEVPLAEELQVSRTPLRDAMSRLAEEGLLDRGKNAGFIVRRFTFEDIIDAIELRGVLEGTAARLAAERGARAPHMERVRGVLGRLDDCFGAQPGDVDFEAYSELNAEFHAELAQLAGSDVMRRELDRVCRLPFASPSAFLPHKANVEAFRLSLNTAQEQHHALVDAIARREAFRAEAIAREHARAARRNLEYAMEKGADLMGDLPTLALLVA